MPPSPPEPAAQSLTPPGDEAAVGAPSGGPSEDARPPAPDEVTEEVVAGGGPVRRVAHPEVAATFLSCLGLLVQVVGYVLGWQGHEPAAIGLWYIGFVALVAPFAWLLVLPARTGLQRLGASLAFSLLMYASWYLTNPVMATRFDESLHVTTLTNLAEGDGFFEPNTMLPVSPHFPGLELATAGVHWLTGLPLMACQVLVVLLARTTFALALFLLASRLGRSTQVGAVTVVLYAGSAQFYFFNSQFSYQTVAIAMLVAALYLLVRAFDSPQDRPWGQLLAVQACLAALAVTHHLTSWLALVLLWGLTLLFRLGGEVRRFRLTLVTAELATVVVAAWTAVIAPLLVSYLGPIFDVAGSELLQVLDGQGARQVGSAGDGTRAPTWELMVMSGSILLWVVLLVPALYRAWRGQTLGPTRARYLPLAISAVYPGLQVARFSEAAGEVSDRASTFVTMAMALIVGAWLAPRLGQLARLVVPAALVLVLGGTLIGSGPDWQRVPGPYLAGAEQRSVDAHSIAVAQWAGTYLPAGSRVAADSTFNRLLPNYAPVTPLTQPAGYDSMTPLFTAEEINREVLELILHNDVDFIVADGRLVGETVRSGSFFEGGAGYGPGALTVAPAQMAKFDGATGFEKVLDGPVDVYDVRGLRGEDRTFVHRDPPGVPGSWTPWQVAVAGLLVGGGLLLRGRLLDPRRFRARDMWRPAVVLPALMLVGAAGVLTGFSPVAGVLVLAVLLTGLVRLSPRPARLPSGPVGGWRWGLAISGVLVLCLGLAAVFAWHGMLDADPLPAPLGVRS